VAQPVLVDAQEIAEILALRDAQVVLDLRLHRLGFPQPVGRRRRALVWLRSEIESWWRGTRGLTEPSSARDTTEMLRP
jgi:predicted DNA-binding transcriptional regulator AlpA